MTAPQTIAPADIQKELTRIWESFDETNKLRACLFNLVIFTHNTPRIEYIQTVAQKVIEKFPSRITLIIYDPDKKEDKFNVRVSVLAASKGEVDIACDFIEMEVSGEALKRVPFVVIPNIIADLPLYLVWASDPLLVNPIFHQLEPYATRIIFDSECTLSLQKFAERLLPIKPYDIADLNWARIESWREVLAATFHRADKLEDLGRVQTIHLSYNAIESPVFCHLQIQAIYLQGWVASQMGWKVISFHQSDKETKIIYDSSLHKVEVFLNPVHHRNLNSGGIVSMEMETTEGNHYVFQRDLEYTHQIHVLFSTPHECELPREYRFPKSESGQSLVYEICHKGTSEHFYKLLQEVSKYV